MGRHHGLLVPPPPRVVGKPTRVLPLTRPAPIPFDYTAIGAVTSPGVGATKTYALMGTVLDVGSQSPFTVISGAPTTAQVPMGYRGIVDGFFQYLEGASGPIVGPRIPGVNVTYKWRVMLNGVPVPWFGAVTQIIAPWNAMSDRPLFYLAAGDQISVLLDQTDPQGLYGYVGVRVKGYFEPLPLTEPRR